MNSSLGRKVLPVGTGPPRRPPGVQPPTLPRSPPLTLTDVIFAIFFLNQFTFLLKMTQNSLQRVGSGKSLFLAQQ